MPYISVKSFPKDEATKKLAVEKINQVFLEVWGCPQEAITISVEEVLPENWNAEVVEPEIRPNLENMMILYGKKTEKML